MHSATSRTKLRITYKHCYDELGFHQASVLCHQHSSQIKGAGGHSVHTLLGIQVPTVCVTILP